MGRFLQQDRVPGAPMQPATLHRYAYAFNNPVNVVDPAGRMPTLGRSVNPANATVGSVTPFIAPARSVNNAGWATYSDPLARQQSVGFRPILCGVAGALFAGQQWLAENPETALGLAIIAGSVIATGGAAIPAILVGAVAGGLFGYGAQVVFNLADPTINGLDIFTHVSWGVIAQSAFHGAVSGAVGGVLSPMLNAVGTGGLTKVALMAAGEFVSGRAQQVAVNLATPGRDWREDLFNPGRLSWWFDVGLDVIPGVTAASTKGAWRGARSLRYADDVSLRQFDEGLDARRTFAASCANSFIAGTLVQTEDGLVPIEDIEVGDRVLGEDPETGEQGYFEVVAVTNHPTDELLAVTVDMVGEEGKGEAQSSHSTTHDVMQVTPEHPVYVEGEGWLLAENLELGDRLRQADGGMAKVLAIDQIPLDTPQPVYNFTVRGPHTYFVLDAGVLVHNDICWLLDPEPVPEHGKELANIAKRIHVNEIIDYWPRRHSTTGVIRIGDTIYVTASGDRRAITDIARFAEQTEGYEFIPNPENIHAERLLHTTFGEKSTIEGIGISHSAGPCSKCKEYLQENDFVDVFWDDIYIP